MTWIGLRDRDCALWQPRGLGHAGGGSNGIRPMPRGAVMVEFTVPGGRRRQNILRYAVRQPETTLLALAFEPGQGLTVLQGRGGDSQARHLSLPDLAEGETVVFTLQWDRGARAGLVTAWMPDRPGLAFATATDPLPLDSGDGARMMGDPEACRLSSDVVFAAISDQPVPVGPVSGMGLSAPVRVPGGWLPALALRAGDAVTLAEGGLARIHWAGSLRLPARGRFRPHVLRAPWNRLQSDVVASGDLRLRIWGSDVDYLFGERSVAARVGQMTDQRRILRPEPPLTIRYRQILLDRPGALILGGAVVEPWDAGALGGDRRLVAVTAPGRAAAAAVAGKDSTGPRTLAHHEVRSLQRLQAA